MTTAGCVHTCSGPPVRMHVTVPPGVHTRDPVHECNRCSVSFGHNTSGSECYADHHCMCMCVTVASLCVSTCNCLHLAKGTTREAVEEAMTAADLSPAVLDLSGDEPLLVQDDPAYKKFVCVHDE